MHAGTIIGLFLALASTLLISLSYLREHEAVAALPSLSLRQPLRSAKLLLGSPAWLLGFAMESGGFALYVAALALAPLALVQSVAAGGVGILAIATSRLARRTLTRRQATGAALAVVGLVLLAVSLTGGEAPDARGSLAAIVLWLGVTVGVAIVIFTSGRAVLQWGVGAGIAGGLFFAAGDICTKVVTEGGGRLVFVAPLIVGYLLGTSLLQIGYQSGAALTVAGLATLFTNAVPIAAGTIVLGEDVPSGALGVIRVLAFGTVTTGAILLARPKPPPGRSGPPTRRAPPFGTLEGAGPRVSDPRATSDGAQADSRPPCIAHSRRGEARRTLAGWARSRLPWLTITACHRSSAASVSCWGLCSSAPGMSSLPTA